MQLVHEKIVMINSLQLEAMNFLTISPPKIQNVTNKKEFMI
jgi:hypothetical protein